MVHVMLVEDDVLLADGISAGLQHAGYSVTHFNLGRHALDALEVSRPDLLILDLGLPDIDGHAVLKQMRHYKPPVATLILTARDDLKEKVMGLDSGADDYLTKPFQLEELLARLRVLARRYTENTYSILSVGDVSLDMTAQTVSLNGQLLLLSRREYMLLKALMERPGSIYTKDVLEHKLYDWGESVSSNTIEVHIHHLRKKLPNGFIQNIRGMGYVINKP